MGSGGIIVVVGRPTYIVGREVGDGDVRAVAWCLGPETAYLIWRDTYGARLGGRYIWSVDKFGSAYNYNVIGDFR